jgi:hypothetical protein
MSPSILYRLRYQHLSLDALTEGISAPRLKERLQEGKWSPFEQMAHLLSYQEHFSGRIDRILKENDPAFERYIAENDPRFGSCLELALPILRENLVQGREAMTRKCEELPEDAIGRTALHPRFGSLRLSEWLEFFLLHEAHHLYALFMLVREGKTRVWK